MKAPRGMTIGVIGCGNMGSALIRGMIRSRFVSPRGIIACDSNPGTLRRIARTNKIRIAKSNREVAGASAVVLAVKPQQMGDVLDEIRSFVGRQSILISIAAGIPSRWIERRVGRPIPVVRVMPNTPALVGAGISAISAGRFATAASLKTAQRILSGVGEVVPVPERWMDAVTALSGSGPAYFFFLMEQMIQEGIHLGLSDAVARSLVVETARGAAELASQSKEKPDVLRARVTSKGGTTEAAFREFEKGKLGTVIRRGIYAAAQRAKELAR